MKQAQSDLALKALVGLLHEFQEGNIYDPQAEREGMERHAWGLSERWNQRFSGFPQHQFPFTSFKSECYRGLRDEHLRNVIVQLLTTHDNENSVIVNPACVFGRHTRKIASRLPSFEAIGTDIFPLWNWVYHRVFRRRTPANYKFIQDDVFDPRLDVKPTAVVFFGACGSVSDGATDYAIRSNSRYLMCRTCCHDNIGGNTTIVHRNTFMNWFFRYKNWEFARLHRKKKYAGFYFSDKYSQDDYPRSNAARSVSNSDQFLEVSRNSVDSDICRTIIDLDRYLHLVEAGYAVWYWGELFVAEKDREAA
ncbi:MAG: hypothetical protein JSU63_00315 [Phycisphaerales bacterium]|nr:MAG: hypothetical protein JSU63_00315 [Phycisphaerales bacterium]